jgi:transcriptional regulator with XRE-family HTH domain
MFMHVAQAVRELRQHLGDSQQSFATRLGLSIRAIANYEKDREPTGTSLVALHRAAREAGHLELAEIFWTALHSELGLSKTAGRKIDDAAVDVGMASALAAQLEHSLRESGCIAAEPQKILRRMRAKLDDAVALLNDLDPYSPLTPGGKK